MNYHSAIRWLAEDGPPMQQVCDLLAAMFDKEPLDVRQDVERCRERESKIIKARLKERGL